MEVELETSEALLWTVRLVGQPLCIRQFIDLASVSSAATLGHAIASKSYANFSMAETVNLKII